MLKHGILGLINYNDVTGYEILAVFRDSLRYFWPVQTSQIYRELRALEAQGWVRVTRVEQSGRPDKNVFSITEAGREELLRWLRADNLPKYERSPLLLKTFFRGECSLEENLAFFRGIQAEASVFTAESDQALQSVRDHRATVDDPMKALYWRMTADFGMMYERMVRDWCAHCIRMLEAAGAGEGSSEDEEAVREE